MEHVTIFRDERFYPSHASAAVTKSGDILVVFRQAPFEHIFAHAHPEASVGMIRSSDSGLTWNTAEHVTVYDPGEDVNINDPSITTLADGTLILTTFNSHAPRNKNEAEWGDRIKGVRGTNYFFVPDERWIAVLRSFDEGRTWEGPNTVDTSAFSKNDGGVFAPVVEFSDGKLLMPISTRQRETGRHVAALMSSDDKGETWQPYSEITSWKPREGPWMGEQENILSFGLPTVAAYDDRNLISAGWSNSEIGTLVTTSDDAGKTWSRVRPVVTKGECSHIYAADNGLTLLSYGYRRPPYGIRVWPSYDRGKTWNPDKAVALRSDGAMRDLGYPRTIQLPNGEFFCVYYFNAHDEDKSYYDEDESMRICREWDLDPPLYTYQEAGLRFIGATIFTKQDLEALAGTATFEPELTENEPTLL